MLAVSEQDDKLGKRLFSEKKTPRQKITCLKQEEIKRQDPN